MNRWGCAIVGLLGAWAGLAQEPPNVRRPGSEVELKYWLGNMLNDHRFSEAEVVQATGLSAAEIAAARKRLDIDALPAPKREPGSPLRIRPYPGGRHPRIGFLEGAIRPQRETKFSAFAPWSETDYVVVDVPEAIWSNLGLTYLAHTHIPTVWTKQNVELPALEWDRRADGSLELERRLPNGIAFATRVVPEVDSVRMEMRLTNGTREKLTDLRVQVCAMLKGASGFQTQTNDNKTFLSPYAACRSSEGKRWIVAAWDPSHRVWGNDKCPCLHADPKFPDCAPGETVRVRGRLWFVVGDDIARAIERLERTNWK